MVLKERIIQNLIPSARILKILYYHTLVRARTNTHRKYTRCTHTHRQKTQTNIYYRFTQTYKKISFYISFLTNNKKKIKRVSKLCPNHQSGFFFILFPHYSSFNPLNLP